MTTPKNLSFELKVALTSAAEQYVRLGLEAFLGNSLNRERHSQAILGNLSIGIELMIKAFISQKSLLLLLRDSSLELKTALLDFETVAHSIDWRVNEIEIRDGKHKTIDFNKCLKLFQIYFPDCSRKLKSHFRFLSASRNISLHWALPSFQRYDLDRTAYVCIKIREALATKSHVFSISSELEEKVVHFLRRFNEERLLRVNQALENARLNAKSITPATSIIADDDWSQCTVWCPICRKGALLFGATEPDSAMGYEGDVELSLNFLGDSFRCDTCGLELKDLEELELAGIDTIVDYDDKIDLWGEEN